jgi:hypothetical protein
LVALELQLRSADCYGDFTTLPTFISTLLEGTYYILAYYLNSNVVTLAGHIDGAHEAAGLRFAARTFRFVGDAALREFLSQARHCYNLEGPVWVATSGYDIEVTNPASNFEPFEKTMAVAMSDLPLGT